jgi:hypothetical protein
MALALVGSCEGLFAQAEPPTVLRFAWHTQEATNLRRATSGKFARVEIVGLNDLCYVTSVSVNQVSSAQEPINPADLFDPKAPGGTAVVGSAPAVASVKDDKGPQGVNFVPPSDPKAMRSAPAPLRAAGAALALAKSRLDLFRELHARAAAALDVSRTASTDFIAAACGTGGRLSSGSLTRVASMAERATTSADTFLAASTFPEAESGLTDAAKQVAQAKALLGSLTPDEQALAAEYLAESGGLIAYILKADTLGKRVDESVAALAAMRAATPEIRTARLLAQSSDALNGTRRNTFLVSRDADSVVIVIESKGRESIAGMKGVTQTDRLVIPVNRRFRVFATTGVLFSFLDEHRYERANRPIAGKDSTYSTFVDRTGNTGFAFAPAVLAHISLARLGDADLFASVGAAARSVNSRTAPDYLVGLSTGFADRFTATIGLHLGREEYLQLGDPEQIAKAPVLAAITRDDAVGERWKGRLAFVFSLRI